MFRGGWISLSASSSSLAAGRDSRASWIIRRNHVTADNFATYARPRPAYPQVSTPFRAR
jgi:hypothetical protein